MKTKNTLHLLVVVTAALSLNIRSAVGQVFTAAEVLNNRAIAASPRAKEAFPWLTRSGTDPTSSQKAAATAKSALAKVKENSAFAASPRMKELYPELARSAEAPRENTVATRTGNNALAEVRRNSALAASPRMKELYPELARGAEKSIEIAPLK